MLSVVIMLVVSLLGMGNKEPPIAVDEAHPPLPIGGPASMSTKSDIGITVSVDLSNTLYFDKQDVPIRISMCNEAHTNVPLVYSTIQRYDFYVTDADDNEIWRWSDSQSFPCIFMIYNMAPGESLSYTTSWKQVDSEGNAVEPGIYYIIGVIAQNPEIATPAAIISITPRPQPLNGRLGPEVVVPPKRRPKR